MSRVSDSPMFSAEQIEQTTRALEQRQSQPLQTLLHGHSEEERIQALSLIKQQWGKDAATNANLPDLQISTMGWPGAESVEMVEVGGKSVYSSSLQLHNLTRHEFVDSQPTVSGPDVGSPTIDVRSLTDRLEAGDGGGAQKLMSGLNEEQKIQALQLAGAMNVQDRHDYKTKVGLGVQVSSINSEDESGVKVSRYLPGLDDGLFARGQMLVHESWKNATGEVTSLAQQDDRPNPPLR